MINVLAFPTFYSRSSLACVQTSPISFASRGKGSLFSRGAKEIGDVGLQAIVHSNGVLVANLWRSEIWKFLNSITQTPSPPVLITNSSPPAPIDLAPPKLTNTQIDAAPPLSYSILVTPSILYRHCSKLVFLNSIFLFHCLQNSHFFAT